MTRSLTRAAAMAGLLAFAGAAPAQQAIELHGVLDVAAGRFQPSGGGRVWRADSGGMTRSFLGLRGTDDLGGGIRATFAIEHHLRPDTGQAGRFDGEAFWGRNAYVGLDGAFGITVLGRHLTPLYVSMARFNAFGESFAFSPAMAQLFEPRLSPFFGGTSWDNAVHFTSPDHDGIAFHLMANLGENQPGAIGKNLAGSLFYTRGPLEATVAWQRVRNGEGLSVPSPAGTTPQGFKDQDTWLLGVAYDIDVAKLFGHYAQVHTEADPGAKTRLFGLGVAVPVGPGRVLAQYGRATAETGIGEPRQRTYSIGYDHALSRRTDLYAVWMNERVRGLASGNTVAGGMRLRF